MVDWSATLGSSDRIELPAALVWVRRVIWLMLVAGQVAFAIVVGMVLANGGGPGVRLPIAVMASIGGATLAVGIVLTLLSRRGIERGSDPAVLRRAAVRNLILPMAVLEGASLFSLIVILVTGSAWPMAVIPTLSLLVQLWLLPKRVVRVRPVTI